MLKSDPLLLKTSRPLLLTSSLFASSPLSAVVRVKEMVSCRTTCGFSNLVVDPTLLKPRLRLKSLKSWVLVELLRWIDRGFRRAVHLFRWTGHRS